jgi:NSS family neurotransmitter:Na+ symporter
MLFLAAITSSISMLQPGIAFLEESLNVGRKVSVALLGLITTFGAGFVVYFTAGLKALDTLDFWIGTLMLFVLATIQIIVFGWHWGIERGFQEMHQGASIRVPGFFRPIIRYVCPAFLLFIFAMWLLKEIFGFDLTTFKAGEVSSYVTDLVGGAKSSQPAQLSIAMAVAVFVFFALITSRSRAYKRAEQGLDKTGN